MTEPIQIHIQEGVDLSGALIIVGAPGLGFVGSIATRYLVERLDMARVGGLHSHEFPPFVPVESGRPLHPVRIHHLETACGLDLACERVVVMTSELFAGPRMVYPLANAILDWADTLDAEMIIVPDAVAAEEEGEKQGLFGIGSSTKALEVLERSDVRRLEEGVLVGLTAGLLSEGERRGADVLSVLAGSAPDHPDARAAAEVVAFLDKVMPGIRLESGPLLKRAEEIEASVRSLRARFAQQAAQNVGQAETPGMSMFH